MALLPQFIAPASPNKPLSFVLLGLVFISTGTIWCLFLALFGSFFSQTLRKNAHVSKWFLRANAGLFAYLGCRLATTRQ
jgi:threonine/homoserine/homoserine lactone efflux protein